MIKRAPLRCEALQEEAQTNETNYDRLANERKRPTTTDCDREYQYTVDNVGKKNKGAVVITAGQSSSNKTHVVFLLHLFPHAVVKGALADEVLDKNTAVLPDAMRAVLCLEPGTEREQDTTVKEKGVRMKTHGFTFPS